VADVVKPFKFRQCTIIIKSTGRKARNLKELRDLIGDVSDESLFHHIYQYFLKGHILEYTNDFAQWAGESLEERALAERLSSLDPYVFASLADLRKAFRGVIDEYLTNFPEPRDVMPGDEFDANEAVTFVFPAGVRAHNLAEFLMAMKYIDPGSIFYHFYDARVRLGSRTDDFSSWVETVLDKKELAGRIKAIDPFMHDLEGIRQHIIQEIEAEVKKDMEVAVDA
jgi:hypothetical protein